MLSIPANDFTLFQYLQVRPRAFQSGASEVSLGSIKDTGREIKSCLGRVFHFKLGSFVVIKEVQGKMHRQILSRKLSPGFVLLAYVCPWLGSLTAQ